MIKKHLPSGAHVAFSILLVLFFLISASQLIAQPGGPMMLHPQLAVRLVVSGLVTPTSIAFLSSNDFLVLEKNTGQVKRVINGAIQSTVLDLAVNFGSERGLLGISMHPDFPANPGVYLFWTESTTGADTNVLSNTSLIGNRVDRFVWDGSSLLFDKNIVMIRALQLDAGQTERGNNNGGVIKFGPDGKLYIIIGDVGRRGQLQNLPAGPFGDGSPDDQFGGPAPDNAHRTGVVLRLNDDGSTPTDNPFFSAGAAMGGEVGANIQKIFSYGHRNSFGLDFDPITGDLWIQENGDDSFDELNRVTPGHNGGWIQIMGPVARITEYKEIETTFGSQILQQIRWPPVNIADSSGEAQSRLYVLPGSFYSDPEFSWKWSVAPAAIGFVKGNGLGSMFEGDLFVGAATPTLEGGYLFHFELTGNRENIGVNDQRLNDQVADNIEKFDITESETLLIGKNFGIATDIETGPNGNLFVVSLTQGAVYEIYSPAQVTIITPQANVALQDGVTFQAQATGASGIDKVFFYVREPDGGDGTPIGYEDLAATFNSSTGYWEYPFDTTVLQDGYYVILAKAIDNAGNEGWSEVVPFSIRNWAVIKLLPATPNNKAGRTMPVKFSLRIAASVDPAMPFVYNEDLEIRIYRCNNISCSSKTLMQTSMYGTGSTDYRINGELYITNFKTAKTPATIPGRDLEAE